MAALSRWIILGAAEIGDYGAVKNKLNKDDFIVCADGGQRHLEPLELKADLYIGDYDSSEMPESNAEIIKLPVEKDDTDTLAALKEGIKRGSRSFLILGGTGGRMDHTFANIQTLMYAEKHGASAALADEKNFAFILRNDTAFIEKNEGEKVSVFAFDQSVSDVTLEGFKYPLKNANLFSHFPVGVSNEIIASQGKITVKKGTLLIIISRD